MLFLLYNPSKMLIKFITFQKRMPSFKEGLEGPAHNFLRKKRNLDQRNFVIKGLETRGLKC